MTIIAAATANPAKTAQANVNITAVLTSDIADKYTFFVNGVEQTRYLTVWPEQYGH